MNAVPLFFFFFLRFHTEQKVAVHVLLGHFTTSESGDLGRSLARASLVSTYKL